MEEMQILNGEYEELRASLEGRNLSEVGIIELRRLRHDYEALHELNLDLQERVRFDRTKDTVEVFETLRLGDELWTNVGEALKPIMEMLRAKAALAMERTKQRRELIESQRRNRATLDSLRANLETTRSLLNLNHDEAAQNIYNSIVEGLELNVRALEELDQSYNTRIQLLENEINVLRFGGSLEELEELNRETEGLSEEEGRRLEREIHEEEHHEEEHHEEETHEDDREHGTGLAGVSFEDDDHELEGIVERGAIVGEDDLNNGLNNEEETHEDEDGLEELPPRPFRVPERTLEEDHHEEETHGDEDGLDELPPRPFRVPERTLEEETHGDEDGLDELPPRPTREDEEHDDEEGLDPLPLRPTREGEEHDDEEGLDPLPPRPGEETHEEEHHEDEEETPVNAKVKQPKSKLWQKLQPVIDTIKVLLLAGLAYHTGLIANQPAAIDNNNNTDIEEETENETDIPTDSQEEHHEEEQQEEENHEEEHHEDEHKPAPSNDDSKPAPSSDDTKPEPSKEEEKPTPTADNVVLAPGESVYNSETGVEVAYNGNATRENNGTITDQQNRNLQKNDNGTVSVSEKDLQPDQRTVPTVEARTGEEKAEEEARKDMTTQEQKNLDEAIDGLDWESFFNEGPTR